VRDRLISSRTDGMPKFVANGERKKLVGRHAKVFHEFISSSWLGQKKCPFEEGFAHLQVAKRRAAPIELQLQHD
jgi:hypothetical protein